MAAASAAALLVAVLSGCDVSTIGRPDDPVVLTGAVLPALVGADPARVVAFAHTRPNGVPTWTQVPVQIDQRKVVAFGDQPTINGTAGVTGSVYGTAATGVTALQYADPNTWVGADGNTAFDADDELVFMVGDAGGRPRDGEATEPAHVVAGSGVEVALGNPLASGAGASIFLFRSDGTLSPGAGRDYVSYVFAPTAGPYKTTYKRAAGPNPETSSVTTANYRIGFFDRWYEDVWQVLAAGATGVDILDGVKNQFQLNYCGRSNKTFNEGEGAFVANVDGPVRAIRAYVGANSGPLTERTHVFYRSREVVTSDLRVHTIPAVMDYLDLSLAARGMTYRSSTVPGGVPVDGQPDVVPTDPPAWELYSGPQGSVFVDVTWATDIPSDTGADYDEVAWFTQDGTDVSDEQCWGDADLIGAAGSVVAAGVGIPNTDPRLTPFVHLSGTRSMEFAAPGATLAAAQAWSDQRDHPVATTITAFRP